MEDITVRNSVNISNDRRAFLQYYKQYLQHYGRKLSPKSYYTELNTAGDKFAYIRASEAKQSSNTWYNQRYKLLTPDDKWLTVISANCHRYTLAGWHIHSQTIWHACHRVRGHHTTQHTRMVH